MSPADRKQISYIVFEVPSNLLLKKMTPRLWQSRICLTWGIVLACHAAIQNKGSYYALRFLLGMMEAGMFPGLAAQLCSWYRSDEMGKPIMWMFGFQNCSGVVGSLLAYGISYMNGMCGMSAWRWYVRFCHSRADFGNFTNIDTGYICLKAFGQFCLVSAISIPS